MINFILGIFVGIYGHKFYSKFMTKYEEVKKDMYNIGDDDSPQSNEPVRKKIGRRLYRNKVKSNTH